MSRIVVSLAKRGREHIYRALAIVELLADHHDVLVLVPFHAVGQFGPLAKRFARLQLFVVGPGRGEAVEYCESSSSEEAAANYRRVGSYDTYSLILNRVQRFSPDLAIAGYEYVLPRIASSLSVKCIRIDYQHLLEDIDPASLPMRMRLRLITRRFVDRVLSPPVTSQIVSAFHRYPVREPRDLGDTPQVQHVGVLLRSELQGPACVGRHLLIKARSSFGKECFDSLLQSKLPARVYGFDRNDTIGNATFRNCSESFAEDLLSCVGVITNTSNQLIGEALACGKPVLAIPGNADYHQQICALFLTERPDYTRCLTRLSSDSLRAFYDRYALPSGAGHSAAENGNMAVKSLIERSLNE